MGIKSLMGLPKTHIAGESLVSASGVLRYCSIARCKASVLSSPFEPVLLVISLFTVFNPTSAIAMGKGHRREAVMDTPVLEEFVGCSSCEFRSAVR